MSKKKQNIIFIFTDQQRLDTINALGYDYMHTPNMDQLVNTGRSYTNAFSCGATCVASRAAIFTGMYPHNTGVYSFDRWSHQKSWVQYLADNGYYCANVGKMHVIPVYDNIGFHERKVIENKTQQFSRYAEKEDEWGQWLEKHGHKRPLDRNLTDPEWMSKHNCVTWELDEELHSDIYCGNLATQWIESWNWDKPLFLEIGFPGPHEPYDPPQRFLDLYKDTVFPEARRSENDLDGKPPQHAAHRHFFKHTKNDESQIDLDNVSLEDIQKLRRHYSANVSLIDEKIGQILDALETAGQLENSVIIFSSDHGDNLGDQGLPYKWLMYDSITNVPLIISDFRQKHQASTTDNLVSLIDIGPTVLDYAGIKTPSYIEGYSLCPKADGSVTGEKRNEVYCEDGYQIMLRTKTHKMVYYIGQEEGELYDLTTDPDEFVNLWQKAECKELRVKLERTLLEWLALSNYKNKNYKSGNYEAKIRLPGAEGFDHYVHGQVNALPEEHR